MTLHTTRTIRTTKCTKACHPEFLISSERSIPKDDLEWLATVLEDSVCKGVSYQSDELIEIGPLFLKVNFAGDQFVLEEPDFKTLPISWVFGVTNSLRALRLQRDTAASLSLSDEREFPRLRESVVIGIDADSTIHSLVLERTSPMGLDSGWFIGCDDSQLDYRNPTNLRRSSIYDAVVTWPQVVDFLALPPGIRVDLQRDFIAISYNGEELRPAEGSFLYLSQKKRGN